MSKERAPYTSNEELRMENLCATWVPLLLTEDQKLVQMQIYYDNLECFRDNKIDLCADLSPQT